MSSIRKCYNSKCEYNYMGGYCNADEISIDENGFCDCFVEKEKEQDEK